ncbi:MAG: alcohol dehydrogenase catalytic domain-containing protein [Bacteriovoracaceae bacterium]
MCKKVSDSLRRIIITKAGDSNVLKLESFQQSRDSLLENEVEIETSFSGLNFADIHMRQGLYQDAPKFPFVPGYEVSGTISKVGKKVKHLKPGDPVMAGAMFGGYSSHIRVPAWQVIPISLDSLSLKEAASVPVSFMTAYIALFELGRIRGTDEVLIDCATGALGQMMIHLMNQEFQFETSISGLTTSERKLKGLKDLGLKAYLSYEEIKASNKQFDLIINSRGLPYTSLKSHLKPLGKVVNLGVSSMISPGGRDLFKAIGTFLKIRSINSIDLMNENHGVHGLNVLTLFLKDEFLKSYLGKWNDYQFRPKVDKVFAPEDVSKAHEYIENRKSQGKVLIDWRSNLS